MCCWFWLTYYPLFHSDWCLQSVETNMIFYHYKTTISEALCALVENPEARQNWSHFSCCKLLTNYININLVAFKVYPPTDRVNRNCSISCWFCALGENQTYFITVKCHLVVNIVNTLLLNIIILYILCTVVHINNLRESA